MITRLSSYLASSNTWIHLTALLFLSFSWVMTYRSDDNIYHVYLNQDKFIHFGKLFLMLCLLMSPQLIYSIFRTQLASLRYTMAIWVVVYIGWPIGISMIPSNVFEASLINHPEVLSIFGLQLLFAEIVSHPKLEALPSKWVSYVRSKISIDYWVLIFTIIISFGESHQLIDLNRLDDSIWTIWPWILLKYLIFFGYYFLLKQLIFPMLYQRKSIIYIGFGILLSILLFYWPLMTLYSQMPHSLAELFIDMAPESAWIGSDAPKSFKAINQRLLYFQLLFVITPLALFSYTVAQSQKLQTLLNAQSQAELLFLKQQINPHFLFNTLNGMYALSLENNKKAGDSILKLSELMRYVIYEANEDRVPIGSEVNYLENYITLQNIRHQHDDVVLFTSQIEDDELPIAPLMFIILLENAYTHGISSTEEAGYIKCDMIQRNREVSFTCINTTDGSNERLSGGLGLDNLRRRLDLIYPERYELITELQNNQYYVHLKIEVY